MPLQSQLFSGDSKLEAAAVSNPAHIVPGAAGPHVGKIQKALFDLDDAVIANGELVAGSYGPSTAAAVLAYKQKRNIINRAYQSTADNIVGMMTMTALDAEMAKSEGSSVRVPIHAQSLRGTCAVLTTAPKPAGPFVPNPDIVLGVTSLLFQIKLAIAAADFRLVAAEPFVTTKKQTLPTGLFNETAKSTLLLLDHVFAFFKLDNPRPAFNNIKTVFRNMKVALNRSFETDPLIAPTLFVPNPQAAMEKIAAAYTSAGGAFFGPKVLLTNGLPANRIYLCSNLAQTTSGFRTQTAIHELAHYVSGRPIPVDDPLHGHFFDPDDGPNIISPEPTVNKKAEKLLPTQKIRDADHYAAFAMLAARGRIH